MGLKTDTKPFAAPLNCSSVFSAVNKTPLTGNSKTQLRKTDCQGSCQGLSFLLFTCISKNIQSSNKAEVNMSILIMGCVSRHSRGIWITWEIPAPSSEKFVEMFYFKPCTHTHLSLLHHYYHLIFYRKSVRKETLAWKDINWANLEAWLPAILAFGLTSGYNQFQAAEMKFCRGAAILFRHFSSLSLDEPPCAI